MLVFFTKLSLIEFYIRYLALYLLFSIIDSFKWFWMESLHKNNLLMLENLKTPFLVLHFSYYTIMTFLTMLPVILLSMLMILLCMLSVTRHLICNNNLNWRLIYETLWTGVRSGLLISMLGKLSWFHLTGLITMVLLMWKWMGLFFRKNNLLRYSSTLDWGSYIISTASKKIGALIRSVCPCMEYCCHVRAVASSCY